MDEIWKSIPGYAGRYEASSLGRIRSLDLTDGRGVHHVGKVLSLQTSHNAGYVTVRLKKADGGKTLSVHRLIARAFLGEPIAPKTDVCHGDGNKHNNVITNLRWDTRSANLREHADSGKYRNQNTQKTHCKYGHEFNEENTKIQVSVRADTGRARRTRRCLTCQRAGR